jgi:hypothetical protein
MTFEKLQDILQKAKDFVVVAGGAIDKSKPEVIELCDTFFFIYKQKVGVGTCRNCIFDAYFELKQITKEKFNFMTQEKKFKLKRFPVYFGQRHQHYTNVNITDEVALEMVRFSRSTAANFENAEELLAALDAQTVIASSPAAETPAAAPKEAAPAAEVVVAEKTSKGIVTKAKPVAPVAPAPAKNVKKKK